MTQCENEHFNEYYNSLEVRFYTFGSNNIKTAKDTEEIRLVDGGSVGTASHVSLVSSLVTVLFAEARISSLSLSPTYSREAIGGM